MLLHSLFYWRILPKNRKTRKLECEKTRVYAQKPLIKMPFKNSISGGVCWQTEQFQHRRHKRLDSFMIFILGLQKLKVKIYRYNLIRVITNCCKSFEVLLLKQYRYRDQRQILIYRTIFNTMYKARAGNFGAVTKKACFDCTVYTVQSNVQYVKFPS